MTRRRAKRILRTVGRLPAGLDHALDCECDACSARRPATRPPFPAAGVALLGTIDDRTLAAQLGVTARAVARERRARKIPPVTAGRKPRGKVAADVHRTVRFTPVEDVAQETAAGDRPWATWAHDELVAAAAKASA